MLQLQAFLFNKSKRDIYSVNATKLYAENYECSCGHTYEKPYPDLGNTAKYVLPRGPKKQVFGSLNITEEKKGIIVIFYKFLVKFFELVVTPTFPVTKQEFDKSNSEIPNDFVQDDSFVEVVEEQEKV